jgi:hypothetical protein
MDQFAEATTGLVNRQLNEMDSEQPKGRYRTDGTRSHSSYGSSEEPEYYSGPEHTVRPLSQQPSNKQQIKDIIAMYDKIHAEHEAERKAEREAKKKGVAEGSDNLAIGQQMARDGIEYDPAQEGEIISQIGDYLKRSGMTPRQIRGYMIDNDFVSDQLSYLPRKSELAEFAPGDDGDDDGFDEDTLRKLAAQWFNGDEDPQVERLLAAAGWEIGQDEGYEDEPGVFVVMSGDENGKSYMSWPAEELRSEVDEGVANADEDPNLAKAYRMGNEAYKAYKNDPARAQAAQDKIEAEFPQYAKMWLTGYRDGERFDKQSVAESRDPVADLRRLLG